jgi:uncharacterized RDD family membrane protein YckC
MKINPLVLHILFMLIAVCSIFSSFPEWFIKMDDSGEMNPNWISTFLYISSIGQLKIELNLFLNFFGVEGNAKAIFLTVLICAAFLVASILYLKNKGKGVVRIMKFGILLTGYNAFFTAIFISLSKLSTPLSKLYEGNETVQSIPYTLLAIVGNLLIAYVSVVYFKHLNKEKLDKVSGQANINLEDSIFSGIGENMGVYTEATVTQRFFNYLVDYIIMIASIFKIGVYIVYSFGWNEVYPNPLSKTILYISLLFAILVYYFFMEKFYGVTLGKIVTNTRVVQEDGNYINWKQAVTRTFSRLVPLEWISAFTGSPWHDRWSNTYVVQEDIAFDGLEQTNSSAVQEITDEEGA